MKIGVKIYSNIDGISIIEDVVKLIDYTEIMAKIGDDFSIMEKYNVPWIIHAQHGLFGTNIADPKKKKQNIKAIQFAQELADKFSSKFIVVHPGDERKSCDIKTSIEVLKEVCDKRILVENVIPYKTNPNFFGAFPDGMKRIMEESGCGFCMDIAHATESANYKKLDQIEFLNDFLKLKPKYMHISDSLSSTGEDQHLHLGEGDFPLKQAKKLIPKNMWVTIETYPSVKK